MLGELNHLAKVFYIFENHLSIDEENHTLRDGDTTAKDPRHLHGKTLN